MNLGLSPGDHIIVAGPNHLDLAIPIYAGLYLGLGVGCVDGTFIRLNIAEFEDIFRYEEPNVIFCQNDKAMHIGSVLRTLQSTAKIITFDARERFTSFSHFLQTGMGQSIEDFRYISEHYVKRKATIPPESVLVHPDTGEDVNEHSRGALVKWTSPVQESLSQDGWLKSGDISYRDCNWNFFFVDRIKMLLKYKNHQKLPVEIESVIRKHSGVFEVAVTGIPQPIDGDLPIACIVTQSEINVTEEEILSMVKGDLSDSKQLRGGVLLMEELPLTVSSKINRTKLKLLAFELFNEKIKALL